jgi:glycosyltransferase involved in cell wall biosynthesis
MATDQPSAVEVTVTVITRNRARILEHCLRGLADQSLDPSRYEIVVVDAGSTDDTTAVIAAAQQRARCRIRAFRYSEHRGLSVVRNRSIREAHGEVIVFVDSDGLVPPSFLSVHLAAHQASHVDIVCRGPIIAVDSLDRPFAARWSLLDLNTSYFDTSNASVRRGRLLAAGLFDEGLADWEGLEMGLRLRQLALRRVYRPNAPLYHYQPAATAESLDGALHIQEARARSAIRFFDRHPTLEVRLITSHTAVHRWLNVLTRGFGMVQEDNLPAWVERCRRWGVPALGRVFTGAVVTARYLSHLQRLANARPASDALGHGGATPPARRRS